MVTHSNIVDAYKTVHYFEQNVKQAAYSLGLTLGDIFYVSGAVEVLLLRGRHQYRVSFCRDSEGSELAHIFFTLTYKHNIPWEPRKETPEAITCRKVDAVFDSVNDKLAVLAKCVGLEELRLSRPDSGELELIFDFSTGITDGPSRCVPVPDTTTDVLAFAAHIIVENIPERTGKAPSSKENTAETPLPSTNAVFYAVNAELKALAELNGLSELTVSYSESGQQVLCLDGKDILYNAMDVPGTVADVLPFARKLLQKRGYRVDVPTTDKKEQ